MKEIYFRTTDEQVRKMEELVKKGIYVNRSDVIRDAIRKFLEGLK